MEFKNLALGKEVKVTEFVPTKNCYASAEKGTKDMLTDGTNGDPSNCYSGEWAHFYRGIGRSLLVDLGGVLAVSGFDIGFIHNKKMGIYCPEGVNLLLSENGTDYYSVASVSAPYHPSFELCTRASYAHSFAKPIRARYAKIEFYVEVNVFADEMRIFGKECDGSEDILSGEPVKPYYKGAYAARDSLGGVHDLPLLYFGYWPKDENAARVKKESFLPYLAYIDREGNIVDTMFDSILFLMIQGCCPSGGCLSYNGAPSKLSDWEYIINELFADGYNLCGLNEAVGEVKSALGLPADYKHKVYLTAPVPKISTEPFGDMNGDGIEEKILTTEDCINAYAWYVDEFKRRFDAECLEHVVIDGWFWNNESASRFARDDEEVFATGCVAELHKRGYKCVMIPYFQAGGTEKIERIGFDCATMQPNLSFMDALQANPAAMMEDFTELCKKYGLGVEIEVHHAVKTDAGKQKYGELFLEYLRSCMRNGMMTDTVHTYYQAAGPGVFYDCAYSSDDYLRGLYDKLYKFIKGTLTESDFAQDADNSESEPEQDYSEILAELNIALDGEPEPESEPEKESASEPIKEKIKKINPKMLKKPKKPNIKPEYKKLAAFGAGFAAAAGLMYIIKKALDD